MLILVTGGCGYIGSHTVVELMNAGYEVVIVDNLVNASEKVLPRIERLTDRAPTFVRADLTDRKAIDQVFAEYDIDAVIHFAGLKAVGESTQIPLEYYRNNLTSSVNLFLAMEQASVFNLVFSSSATVYGDKNAPPYHEEMTLSATNPYGQTKLMIEQMIDDMAKADTRWRAAKLRYFNPVGAHPSGYIGEDPNGIPNNLMPFITQVAVGRREKLNIFGGDYPTPDGTCIRDYIHVVDLAKGHLKALEKTLSTEMESQAFNLGAGKGYSVLEVTKAFEATTNVTIPFDIVERRAGDLPEFYANPEKALNELNWQTEQPLSVMCRDAWGWQSKNENGYE